MIGTLRAVHRAGDGLAADLGLYLAGALFAGYTAFGSTLPAHRAWGGIAVVGYLVASGLAAGQLIAGGRWRNARARALVIIVGWVGGTIVPLLVQAVQRAAGHPYRAQEEVTVVEWGAERLLDTGTPYLTRDAIAAAPDPLLSYLPYQPGMVGFGLPRALAGTYWWTDARIWFAIVTGVVLLAALRQLRDAGSPDSLLLRAAQAVTVLPICALTLATGGDDLPVLALCLLALGFAARGRWSAAGIVVGTAAALKLFAWPVVVVLLAHALATSRSTTTAHRGPVSRLALPALGIPLAVLLPVTILGPAAVWENLVRFPMGLGLVKSPAASPLPGHLVATLLPGGRWLATGLLLAAAVGLAVWLLRRSPGTAAAAANVCAAGLLIAILLMPATRFGYLLYPAAFAVWAVASGHLTGVGTRPTPVPSKAV